MAPRTPRDRPECSICHEKDTHRSDCVMSDEAQETQRLLWCYLAFTKDESPTETL